MDGKRLGTTGVALVLLAVCVGCTAVKTQTPFMKTAGAKVPAEELRIRVRNLASPMVGDIEGAAHAIESRTDDPAIRRSVLEWKARSVPMILQAVFQPDPLVALLDAWALSIQMRNLVETADVAARLGEYQSLTVDACRTMEGRAVRIMEAYATPDQIETARGRLEDWAAANPLHTNAFGRSNLSAELAQHLVSRKSGALATVGSLAVDLGDIATRLDTLTMQVPKLASWEAEMFLMDRLSDDEIHAALGDLDTIPGELIRLNDTVDHVLDQVGSDQLAERLAAERDRLLAEWRLTLEFVADQREDVLEAVAKEREIVLEALGRERAIVLAAITGEREAVLGSADAAVDRSVNRLVERVDDLADRILLKVALLLLGGLLLAWFASYTLVRVARSRA
jgi:hypothetical protein